MLKCLNYFYNNLSELSKPTISTESDLYQQTIVIQTPLLDYHNQIPPQTCQNLIQTNSDKLNMNQRYK